MCVLLLVAVFRNALRLWCSTCSSHSSRCMSKRRERTKGACRDSDTKERRHVYSVDAKRICVALLEHEGTIKLTPDVLANVAGFPAAATLREWREAARNPPADLHLTATPGRPPLLSDEQLMIVGGFVLFCAERHQTCGGKEIIAFIGHAFEVTVDKSWVAKNMEHIGISSHRPASLKFTFGGSQCITSAVKYLGENQSVLRKIVPRSRVVAIDQISFWDCGVSESTYSAIGACGPVPIACYALMLSL